MQRGKYKRVLGKIVVLSIWIAIWQIAYMMIGQEILMVSPVQVLGKILTLGASGDFWLSVGGSILRISGGYLIALGIGSVLAVLTSFIPAMDAFFRPMISIIKATPVASFIMLALVWIVTGQVPVFTSFLMVLPIVWGNVTQGIRNADRRLLEMASVFRLRQGLRLKRIYLPSLMPYFMAAATTGMGLAWKAGIAAEVLCRPEFSIGRALYNSKIYLETMDLFAWTAVVIALSILLERGFVRLVSLAGRRYNVPGGKEMR